MSESVKTVDLGQSERKIDRLVVNEGFSGAAFGLGTFTATAAGVTTVTDASIAAGSVVVIFPVSAAAGLIVKSKSCYVTPAAGSFTFTISATGAGAPAGTEVFSYISMTENA